VRNGEGHIAAALDSLFAQTDDDFEIIAVDDSSTDKTPAILNQRSRADKRLRVLSTSQGAAQGIVAALNRGIAAAQGRYIARMDADDLCRPERLRLQAEYLDAHADVGLVASRVEFAGDRQAQRGLALFVDWTNELLTPADIARSRFVETPIIHPSVMFRRELVALYGGYRSGDFPEDYELWLRWLDRGVTFAKLQKFLLEWTDRQDRLTRVDPRYGAEAFFRVKAPYIARWLAANNPAHPRVVVWGAGRTARRRFRHLAAEGVEPIAYVDIDPKKIGWKIAGVPVISPDEIPGAALVLIYVGKRRPPSDRRLLGRPSLSRLRLSRLIDSGSARRYIGGASTIARS
jgi:glycosyltransferase involved in cell wall biosynthesis